MRETEARVREILHMDYDTFINTAFLLQGRADLFTRGTPASRKECLAEVLDLSYYQRLEARARERSRSIQDGVLNAEFIANDKPLLVSYASEWYFPVLVSHSERTFGGDFETEAEYRELFVQELIESDGWILWPPVRFGYSTIN